MKIVTTNETQSLSSTAGLAPLANGAENLGGALAGLGNQQMHRRAEEPGVDGCHRRRPVCEQHLVTDARVGHVVHERAHQ
eukprot:9496940-Pyramimonas_sp.AAC.1